MSHSFDDYLREQGIRRQITCRYAPQQNGVAKRKTRVIADIARAMMNEMNMPLTYWAEAVHTAVHIMNQTPTAAIHEISPYERLYGSKPTVSYMKFFGCVCYVHVPNEARKKMEPKAVKCIFLGYPIEKKGYKCYDPTTRQVYVSRDVRFCEHEPWYKPKPVMIEDEYEEQKNVRHVVDEPRPSTRTISRPHMTEESTRSVNPGSGRLRDKKQDEKGKKKVFEESSGDEGFDEEHGLPHLRTLGSKYAEKYSQLTRKEAQNHELIKNDKKIKEQLKNKDARFQKLNASYNTIKNTLIALLQNQEPAVEAPSTFDSAALNTLAALQAELQTKKLQRQLLVSGFMSQTAQHEAKVKQLEEELAKAKAELAAVGSLASTSHIQQAETHVPIQPPQLPEMPEFQGIEEEEQQRPAPGALDIREEIEQEIEDFLEGPAKEYLMYEKKVMQLAALAFLQPEEQIKDFGTDFLPLPLMRHEAILWKEKMRPALQRNKDGGYEGISLTTEEAKTLIKDHPRWRRKWLIERPRDLTNFHNTPQSLQIDPTYFPVLRQRTWAEFQKWRGKNKALLNYPVLSAQEPPTVNYVVNTLNTTIQMLREVPDISCQMLVKIARMIVTCIQVFKDTEDDDHPWNLFLEGRRGICWNLRDSPPRWISWPYTPD
ncbi:hypothetical protein L7F22_002034 [Adiantum nelumboides]|nr:hypothetical protein [Adiantum nelumboides]